MSTSSSSSSCAWRNPRLPKGMIAFEVDAPTALKLADKMPRGRPRRLHRLGCPMVLDDFALTTECFALLRLPGVRYVKLAPEITAKMRTDKLSQAAITAVVQMARVLGHAHRGQAHRERRGTGMADGAGSRLRAVEFHVAAGRRSSPCQSTAAGAAANTGRLVCGCESRGRVAAPAAAQRLHQVHRRGELLPMHLHGLPLIAQQRLLRRDHLQIRIHPALVARGRDVEGVLGALDAGIGLASRLDPATPDR